MPSHGRREVARVLPPAGPHESNKPSRWTGAGRHADGGEGSGPPAYGVHVPCRRRLSTALSFTRSSQSAERSIPSRARKGGRSSCFCASTHCTPANHVDARRGKSQMLPARRDRSDSLRVKGGFDMRTCSGRTLLTLKRRGYSTMAAPRGLRNTSPIVSTWRLFLFR